MPPSVVSTTNQPARMPWLVIIASHSSCWRSPRRRRPRGSTRPARRVGQRHTGGPGTEAPCGAVRALRAREYDSDRADTNTSGPSPSGLTKPKPFSALNHFTVPIDMRISPPMRIGPSRPRGPLYLGRLRWRPNPRWTPIPVIAAEGTQPQPRNLSTDPTCLRQDLLRGETLPKRFTGPDLTARVDVTTGSVAVHGRGAPPAGRRVASRMLRC